MIPISQIKGYQGQFFHGTVHAFEKSIERNRAKVAKVMKSGRSEAMAQAGTGTISKFVRGARKMLSSL
jgi:hypothetical protein